MALQTIQLLRNIGQFDSVTAGAQLPFTKLSLIYAENGRGKTTLAAILRSLGTGTSQLITERHRLGAINPPHVVINAAGGPFMFQNGIWGNTLPSIAVFDDAFVSQNVCSGVEIESSHRQNLHELIIGDQGVALNSAVQTLVGKVEQHNKDLKIKGDAIPATARGALTVDDFCALPNESDIDAKIDEAERLLATAQSANTIQQATGFLPLQLPAFDSTAVDALLAKSLANLEAGAASQVQQHLAALGKNGESWVSDGMQRLQSAANKQPETCPFCAQNLSSAPLIGHYQAYFSQEYESLKKEITAYFNVLNTGHSGEVQSAFERSIRVAVQSREFWKSFFAIPEIVLDTAEIARAWKAARESVLGAISAKQAAPLEPFQLSAEAKSALQVYESHRSSVSQLSTILLGCNQQIAISKEQAGVANVPAANSNLQRLRAIKARYSAAIAPLCNDYLADKAAKSISEQRRDAARVSLDQYRGTIFPAYETAINIYLQRFNAGYRLLSVSPVNMRGGSSCNYSVLINNETVALNGNGGPSFKNTLSAGDRNTLALAFFFASLDQDPQLAQKIVVIDDPMTSLDEHRSLTTVQEIRRLLGRVDQLVVMSHSKPFLCAIWDGADVNVRSAMRISRDAAGSTLTAWDVRQDCITEHDRRHEQVADYLATSNPDSERTVASALRPILEAFMRVAYPASFPPGTLLGPFLGACRQKQGTAGEILNAQDITELRDLLDYANKFHHDTNPAWETETINDQELVNFCRRTMAFTRRA